MALSIVLKLGTPLLHTQVQNTYFLIMLYKSRNLQSDVLPNTAGFDDA